MTMKPPVYVASRCGWCLAMIALLLAMAAPAHSQAQPLLPVQPEPSTTTTTTGPATPQADDSLAASPLSADSRRTDQTNSSHTPPGSTNYSGADPASQELVAAMDDTSKYLAAMLAASVAEAVKAAADGMTQNNKDNIDNSSVPTTTPGSVDEAAVDWRDYDNWPLGTPPVSSFNGPAEDSSITDDAEGLFDWGSISDPWITADSQDGSSSGQSSDTGTSSNIGRLVEGVRQVSGMFRPMGDDESRLERLRSERRAAGGRRNRPWVSVGRGPSTPNSASSSTKPSVKPFEGRCSTIKNKALDKIDSAFKRSLQYTVQSGALDFGFLGTEDETKDCGDNCAYTNPNSPYGLTVLPMAPGERPQAKETASTTPTFVKKDLQQRRESGVILTKGEASVWQLLPDEVVVVAGCLPPAQASRYFAFTPYVHSVYDAKRTRWIPVFAALGDSVGVYRLSNRQTYGVDNRINASLVTPPGPDAYAPTTPRPLGTRSAERVVKAFQGVLDSRAPVQAPAAPSSGNFTSNSSSSSSTTTNETSVSPQQDYFDRFTIVVMAATQMSVRRVQSLLQPVLDKLDLQDSVNVLGIPAQPFARGMGLDLFSPYYMLIARNIVPAGQLSSFKSYMAGQPWASWRLTPLGFSADKAASVRTRVVENLAANTRVGTTAATMVAAARNATLKVPFNPSEGFPLPAVVPRHPVGINQSEEWLRPAFNHLLETINKRYQKDYATEWSLGADSALETMGIDWGIDCYNRFIDFCNGDNRDAQYVTSLPLNNLDRMSKVVLLVGTNHQRTGLAAYFNIAPSDPVQRLGLNSFDDSEVLGSAREWLAGSAYQELADYLYVVRFARNCTGLPYCKEISTEGARSLPLSRSFVVMLRAYVDPATGVGPAGDSIIMFRTLTITPKAEARPMDYQTQVNNTALMASPCKNHLAGTALCLYGPDSNCCSAVQSWNNDKCWCSPAGRTMLQAMPPLAGASLMVGLGRMCGSRSNIRCS